MTPRVTLLATGGTIASQQTEQGLMPLTTASGILDFMPSLRQLADITARDVFMLDSSNIQPEEWQLLAQAVKQAADQADGIIITHGTDTMAYTASALSFMLPGIGIPIVFTGSQLPLTHPHSDAPGNLREAFAMALSGRPGVFIAFQHKVIYGTRAVKIAAVAHCPVAVVPFETQGDPTPGAAVGVDGSEASQKATAFAAEQASTRDVPLIAVYAWMPP